MFDANATDIIFGVVIAIQHKPDLFEELIINYESLDANEALTLDMKMAEMMLGPGFGRPYTYVRVSNNF